MRYAANCAILGCCCSRLLIHAEADFKGSDLEENEFSGLSDDALEDDEPPSGGETSSDEEMDADLPPKSVTNGLSRKMPTGQKKAAAIDQEDSSDEDGSSEELQSDDDSELDVDDDPLAIGQAGKTCNNSSTS